MLKITEAGRAKADSPEFLEEIRRFFASGIITHLITIDEAYQVFTRRVAMILQEREGELALDITKRDEYEINEFIREHGKEIRVAMKKIVIALDLELEMEEL